MAVVVSFYHDLHPFECGQNCVHCRKAEEGDHVPWLCVFCFEDLEVLFPAFLVPVTYQLSDAVRGREHEPMSAVPEEGSCDPSFCWEAGRGVSQHAGVAHA